MKSVSRKTQRVNLTSASSTAKKRMATSNPHKGSRVEPSFVQDRKIGERIRTARKRSR